MYKLNYQTYQEDMYRYQFPLKILSFFVQQIVLTPLELLFNMFMTALKSFFHLWSSFCAIISNKKKKKKLETHLFSLQRENKSTTSVCQGHISSNDLLFITYLTS
jgi:hypothetical protein